MFMSCYALSNVAARQHTDKECFSWHDTRNGLEATTSTHNSQKTTCKMKLTSWLAENVERAKKKDTILALGRRSSTPISVHLPNLEPATEKQCFLSEAYVIVFRSQLSPFYFRSRRRLSLPQVFAGRVGILPTKHGRW